MSTALRELIKDVAVEHADSIVGSTIVAQVANQALQGGTSATPNTESQLQPPEPPAAPSGVVVTVLQRRVVVAWALPPDEQYVRTTVIEAIPPAPDPVVRQEARTLGGSALLDVPYPAAGPAQVQVRLWHRDLWGRNSATHGPVNVTPAASTVDFLVADRILAGTLNAVVSITSGGRIQASGARMDGGGISLTETADQLSAPGVDRGSKITPLGTDPFAAMQFFRVAGISRGVHQRADGVAGGIPGELRLEATGDANPGGNKAALVQVRGGADGTRAETFVQVRPHFKVVGDTVLNGELEVASGPFTVDADGNVGANTLTAALQIAAGASISSGGNVNADGELRAGGRITQLGTPFEVNELGGVLAAALAVDGNASAGGKVSAGTDLEFSGEIEQTGAGAFAVGPTGAVFGESLSVSGPLGAANGAFVVAGNGRATSFALAAHYASASVAVGAGSFQDFSHGLGVRPAILQAFFQTANGFRPLPDPSGLLYVDFMNATNIRVRNDTAAQQQVYVRAYRE